MKWLILLSAILFIGCSGPTITSNYDDAANFNSYQTFSFADNKVKPKSNRAEYENPAIGRLIRKAISKELTEVGYKLTTQNPDLLVFYEIVITENIDPRVDSARMRMVILPEPVPPVVWPLKCAAGLETHLLLLQDYLLIMRLVQPLLRAWAKQ